MKCTTVQGSAEMAKLVQNYAMQTTLSNRCHFLPIIGKIDSRNQ